MGADAHADADVAPVASPVAVEPGALVPANCEPEVGCAKLGCNIRADLAAQCLSVVGSEHAGFS